MERNKMAMMAAFVLIAAMASTAFAAGTGGQDKAGTAKETGYYLQARAQHLTCTIDFSTTVMNDVVAVLPQGSSTLTADIAKLNADKSQLSTLATAGDPKAFDDFASGTLKSDATQSVSDLHTARQGFGSEGVTNDTRTQLQSEYDAARSTFASCNNGAVGTLLQARITQFTAVISNWNTKIATFGQKGFDTAAMQTVASGGTSNVVSPLQAALQTGDLSQMKTALETYCLGDGCGGKNANIQEYDYHGYAKIALETLQSVVNKAENDPRMANATAMGLTIDTSKLQDAKAQLDSVRSTLATVGTNKYATEQDTAIWNGLKQASQDVKDYQQGLKDAMQQFRQQMITQRQGARGNRTGNFTGGRGGFGGRNFSNRSGGNGNENGNNAGTPPAAPSSDGQGQSQ